MVVSSSAMETQIFQKIYLMSKWHSLEFCPAEATRISLTIARTALHTWMHKVEMLRKL